MTYSMIVGKYKLIFSDTHFKDFRKKPTVSVYDADTNSETKIASFNSQESFEWFIELITNADRKTENSSEIPNNSTCSKMEQVPNRIDCTHYGDYEVCKGCDDDYNKFKSYYEPKDEPQTDTEIARAIVHKAIDNSELAEYAYPNLRQRLHDAVDEYEPQTERSSE